MKPKYPFAEKFRDQILRCSSCGFCRAVCPVFGLTKRPAFNARGKMLVLKEVLDGTIELSDELIETLFQCTAINCLTACCPEAGKVPLTYPSDREAIAAALATLRPYGLDDLRIVHIKNTLELENLAVSKGCLSDLQGKPNLTIEEKDLRLEFDGSGNLLSPFQNPTLPSP